MLNMTHIHGHLYILLPVLFSVSPVCLHSEPHTGSTHRGFWAIFWHAFAWLVLLVLPSLSKITKCISFYRKILIIIRKINTPLHFILGIPIFIDQFYYTKSNLLELDMLYLYVSIYLKCVCFCYVISSMESRMTAYSSLYVCQTST